jgi:hypothetical protein
MPGLAAIAGENQKAFTRIWPRLQHKFPVNGAGRRCNQRIAKEIAKADELSRKRAASAKQKHS